MSRGFRPRHAATHSPHPAKCPLLQAPQSDWAEPTHLLDAYFFHHTGKNALRCMALSKSGAVYEGDWSVLDGGGLQFDLTGYEGDRVVQLAVRLDPEPQGTLRQRVWSPGTSAADLLLDVHHKPVEPKGE